MGSFKQFNKHIIDISVAERRVGELKQCKEIMAKIFPYLKKPTDTRSSPYHKQYKYHTHTHI